MKTLKKKRVIDAIAATKAAVEEGIVPGGGITLLYIGKKLLEQIGDIKNDTVKEGNEIVARSLFSQIKKLFLNAGMTEEESGARVKELVKLNKDAPVMGYELETEGVVDMYKKGVIDPKKVVRSALQNASSCASMILTTDCLVAKEEETKDEKEN